MMLRRSSNVLSRHFARWVTAKPLTGCNRVGIAQLTSTRRLYATMDTTGTDPDFAPKAKQQVPAENEETLLQEAVAEMKKDIAENPIVLFMKGRPKQPQCGFSARVVQILSEYDVRYISYDVLADPYVRAGVKKIADWPTLPQLYVKGEFVGGCDIVMEMHKNGDLKKLLEPLKVKK